MATIKNIGKHYNFTNDSWWDSPGCSCCEATLMDAFNCDEPELSGLGTAHSEDAIVSMLAVANNIISEEKYDDCDLKRSDIQSLLNDYGISYSIED